MFVIILMEGLLSTMSLLGGALIIRLYKALFCGSFFLFFKRYTRPHILHNWQVKKPPVGSLFTFNTFDNPLADNLQLDAGQNNGWPTTIKPNYFVLETFSHTSLIALEA